MPRVHWDGVWRELAPQESVLDGLLRNGITIPFSCKAGSCGSCMVRCDSGELPPRAQSGLKESWKQQGYFYACVCVPEGDLEVAPLGAGARASARIAAICDLSASVKEVRLEVEGSLDFRAGQYITLTRNEVSRSYSIASLPSDGYLSLHVRKIPQGKMSGWVHDHAQPGDVVSIMGPFGECFYVPGQPERPLLLAGTGTGLAPLWGVVQDALAHRHTGPIHLFHGAIEPSGLYLRDELRHLAAQFANVTYSPVVLEIPIRNV